MKLKENCVNYCEIHSSSAIDNFASDVRKGLLCKNKYLHCKYIYDDEGSRLFQEIMRLPEYYLTDCEAEILRENRDFFCEVFGDLHFHLVELGAGDGMKTRILINHFLENKTNFHYVPVDISSSAIEELVYALENDFEELKTTGLVTEYFQGLKHLSDIDSKVRLVLFMGSNIGNMNSESADEFLRGLHRSLESGDYLLIGFDLIKDIKILTRAYNDSRGITERFNKNLLVRINRELGGNFDIQKFKFYSTYDPQSRAIKSYLISSIDQEVYIDAIDSIIKFKKGEAIHTESSYKYHTSEIQDIAERNGFAVLKNLFDGRGYFTDSLWQVRN